MNAKLFSEDSKMEVQISQKGSITGENVVVRETVYFTEFGSSETFRGLDTLRQGPERDGSDYVFKLDCDDRADGDGEQAE